jgi:bifunctional enzyme CysN/CysC
MELLRFATAGSVDDGKSTLIGRLLHDTKSIFEDQLAAVEAASVRMGADYTNLALLTDGLRAEREQGITIDVAYRYFATPNRKFIVADTPGHLQYTRNMVTGASTADLALVLIDARKGVLEQSRRHAFVASLLGIRHITACVNKMDLVEWDRSVFEAIATEFRAFGEKLGVPEITCIPVSALHGDNVVEHSANSPWYEGPSLMEHLEALPVTQEHAEGVARFPVQYVLRPHSNAFHDYRGYAGTVAGGLLRPGDAVTILPSGVKTSIAAIDGPDGELDLAFAPMSVAIRLKDEVDVSRGDLICPTDSPASVAQELEATVCWFAERSTLKPGSRYALKHTTRWTRAVVTDLHHHLDVTTLEQEPNPAELKLNEIGSITLKTATPLSFDPYSENRTTGSFILVDEATNATVAAGLLRSAITA